MNAWISAAVIFAAFIVLSLIFRTVFTRLGKHADASTSEVFRLLANSQQTILIFIGLVLALSELGFDISALVAGLGLTGFAVGLALKDAISNLVSGMMLVVYKTIELGNVIELSGVQGEVININLRYITLDVDGIHHLIPNALLLNSKLAIIDPKTTLTSSS
ncbi:MAG: mechanosensitive ion channel domain-containing protein [Pseudomonadales bacterium]|jgi:small-conductance mechanosensitive channel